MTIIQSLIMGIVEGISEFLPISSTGHLILTSSLLHIEQSNFTKSFEIIIQLGAILSVVLLYWKIFFNIELIKKLIVGFIPTGIIGLVLYKIVKMYLVGNQNVVLFSLFIGGVILIVFEIYHKESPDVISSLSHVSYKQSFIIGIFQSIAIIPGISRSASTIIGGLVMGLNRKTIVEFSFLLAVPTMLAATGLDLIKNVDSFSIDQVYVLLLGLIVSFAVAMLSINFLLNFVKKHNFIPFGIYRIIIASLFWLTIVNF